MGRPKGGKNQMHTKEEKMKYVKMILDEGYSVWDLEKSSAQVTRETGISNGMLSKWVKKYNENGIDGLKNQKKPGNPLSRYSNRKNLTKEEELEYENMKLRIENELLKKGYLMKGDGTIVKFTK